jgi:hypothetical protein
MQDSCRQECVGIEVGAWDRRILWRTDRIQCTESSGFVWHNDIFLRQGLKPRWRHYPLAAEKVDIQGNRGPQRLKPDTLHSSYGRPKEGV